MDRLHIDCVQSDRINGILAVFFLLEGISFKRQRRGNRVDRYEWEQKFSMFLSNSIEFCRVFAAFGIMPYGKQVGLSSTRR